MKIGLITSVERKSGIANYSRNLREGMPYDLFKWDYQGLVSVLFSPIKEFFNLRKFFKEHSVVHVQYHVGEQGPLFLPLMCLIKGKMVITMHEDHRDLGWFWVWWHNIWLRRADKILVHTNVHKEFLSEGLHSRTSVMPFGVKPMGKSEVPAYAKYSVLIPGFINRWKNVDIVIIAMKYVVKKYPDATLHVVGKAWDKKYTEECVDLVEKLGLQQNVFIISDFVVPEVYDRYMREAAVIVIPYSRSTMSNVLAEAIGYRKETIVSDIPPFKEYAKGKLFVAKVNCPEEVSGKICDVFRGKRCKVRELVEEYCWERVRKLHWDVYNSEVTNE